MSSTAIQLLPPIEQTKASENNALRPTYADASDSRGKNFIRRPTRGIVLKEDTFATMRVVARGSGRNILLVDAGSRRQDKTGNFLQIGNKRATDIYSNFLLQSIQEERQEKHQTLETFGEPYIFLFGQRARVMNFMGVLANTWDFNWEAEWWTNYENYLRGTKCVENDARIMLSFDQTVVGGYMLMSTANKTAEDRNFVRFQFTLFVTEYYNYSNVGNPIGIDVPLTNLVSKGQTVESLQKSIEQLRIGDLFDYTISSAQAEILNTQERPRLIDNARTFNMRYSVEQVTNPDGTVRQQVVGTDLDTAIKNASPGAFTKFWRQASTAVGRVIDQFSGLYSGFPVRVPSDFSGAFAYDDTTTYKLKQVMVAGAGRNIVKYGTFAQNEDEYVGSGDQYGSTNLNGLRSLGYVDIREQYEKGYDTYLEAVKYWQKNGYTINTAAMDAIGKAFQIGRMGLVAFTVTKNALGFKGFNNSPFIPSAKPRTPEEYETTINTVFMR